MYFPYFYGGTTNSTLFVMYTNSILFVSTTFTSVDMHVDSKWVAFTLEVLEYKLGNNALQYAVCSCAVRFASTLVGVRERLVSPDRLLCEECKATSDSMYLL